MSFEYHPIKETVVISYVKVSHKIDPTQNPPKRVLWVVMYYVTNSTIIQTDTPSGCFFVAKGDLTDRATPPVATESHVKEDRLQQ